MRASAEAIVIYKLAATIENDRATRFLVFVHHIMARPKAYVFCGSFIDV